MSRYKIPNIIEKKLQEKYTSINVSEFINDLFTEIQNKSISDGSCLIYNFGHFFAFKNFSNKKFKFQPRFKFKVSRALIKKMADDPYILDQINLTTSMIFDQKKMQDEKYLKNREKSQNLQNIIKNNSLLIKEKDYLNEMKDEIYSLFEEGSNNHETDNKK